MRMLCLTACSLVIVSFCANASGQRLKLQDQGPRYPVLIDLWAQLTALTPGDEAGAAFGGSVAISGQTMVVGAPFTDDIAGKAYVFVRPPSGWKDAMQVAELSASDGAAYDTFADSVAISGDTIVVGAPGHNMNTGEVYVFVKPETGWSNMTETAKLTKSGGMFGTLGDSVAIGANGDTIVAGAPSDTDLGAVYVFVKPQGGWKTSTETAKLTAPDGQQGQALGQQVAVAGNGDTIAAAAPGFYLDSRQPTVAYLFVKPPDGWKDMTETTTLTASDYILHSQFGYSVAIGNDGATVLVGACNDYSIPGGAYVFLKPRHGWKRFMTESAKLTINSRYPPRVFANVLSISHNTVVVGSPYENDLRGAVYVYVRPKTGWISTSAFNARLADVQGNQKDYFGSSQAIHKDTIIVGAPGVYVQGGSIGTAYIFGKVGGTN